MWNVILGVLLVHNLGSVILVNLLKIVLDKALIALVLLDIFGNPYLVNLETILVNNVMQFVLNVLKQVIVAQSVLLLIKKLLCVANVSKDIIGILLI